MAHVSDIKLIRTDTTLDLSQKAEKGKLHSEATWTDKRTWRNKQKSAAKHLSIHAMEFGKKASHGRTVAPKKSDQVQETYIMIKHKFN
ncbi:hypothetical protein GOBAR_AA25272 [Gossypium barbadense]|uniref:Uncharacterized protein n=1 Tax=Gossypium barbadense TaxID=3634 RepID=A0A2P5WWC6_GOSBA|nr:hypothetical protein GOBAR_AA25272 [Gossypium barbadense]